MSEKITADVVVRDANLPDTPTGGALTLFGTDDPVKIIAIASHRARALADVIRQSKLVVRIDGHDHVKIEGWTLLGSMSGVFGVVEWTRETDHGWEARANAVTLGGQIVGAAEAVCLQSERGWAGKSTFELKSMAQTRAISKALRMPLGFIMVLAGYNPTPADEMRDVPPRRNPAAVPSKSTDGPGGPRTRPSPPPDEVLEDDYTSEDEEAPEIASDAASVRKRWGSAARRAKARGLKFALPSFSATDEEILEHAVALEKAVAESEARG